MATPKYKKFFELMIEQNEKLFDKFEKIHDAYLEDPDSNEDTFHKVGRDVLDTARFWERKLCSGMMRGNNAVYSGKLSEKFWDQVRSRFSQIDMVGVQSK